MENSILLPDWFVLMKQWLEQGKGDTGITFSFLAGALALKQDKHRVHADELRALIDNMISNPVPNYYIGIRWCGNIDAPVLSPLEISAPLLRKYEFFSPGGQISLAFSPDSTFSIGGLDCDSKQSCIEKLINYSLPHTKKGNFSRVRKIDSSGYTYREFDQSELEFVRAIIG